MSDSASDTKKPAGESATQAVAIQGVTDGVPVAISGSFSATTSAHATAAAPTYVEGTDNPLSVDLSGNLRTSGGGGGGGSSSFSNDGTTAQLARVSDTDTGGGTHWTAEVMLVTPGAGGPAQTGTASSPLRVDPTGATTQPVSGSVSVSNFPATQPVSGTVAVSNFPASQAVTGTFFQATQPVSIAATVAVQGAKTNNNAAPGATNVGALNALANAAVPAWTEGNLVLESSDLAGAIRSVTRPPVVTGAYRIQVTTAQYTALAAGASLISFRFTAAALCIVTRVRVFVTTQTASSAAGRLDRALFVVRSFTAADSGGTAVTLTSPVGKLRTSHAATGVGNLMVSSGNALTNGTGTQDANPVAIMARAGTATEPIGLTLPASGTDADLFVWNAGQNYPIVLAQNEGLRITIPTAMPASIAQITSATFEWYEVASANF